jgi:hypothetical protein
VVVALAVSKMGSLVLAVLVVAVRAQAMATVCQPQELQTQVVAEVAVDGVAAL